METKPHLAELNYNIVSSVHTIQETYRLCSGLVFSGLQILTSLKSEVNKAFSLVYDETVIKEWVKDKLQDGIDHLTSTKPVVEELKKIAAGKEGKES